MTDENIKEILACIIKHIRPDGDFYSFTSDEVERMKKLLGSEIMIDEEKVIKTNFIDVKRYGYKYKKCGNCEEEFLEQYVYRWFFCPRCGAKFINVTQ